MSADLFAAFDDPPTQHPGQGQPKPSSHGSAAASQPDPFSLLGPAPNSTSHQQTQPWPSLQSADNDIWGNFADGHGSGHTSLGPAGNPTEDAFDDDGDGWGDFETAEPAPKPFSQPTATTAPSPALTQPALKNPAIQRTRILRAPTIELMTNSLIDIPGANTLPDEVRSPPWARQSFGQQERRITHPATQLPKPIPARSYTPDPNVLFDADEFDGDNPGNDEDDDFGDFETTASPVPAASQDLIAVDLFAAHPAATPPPPRLQRMDTADVFAALTVNQPMSPYPQAPKSPSYQDRNPFPGLALKSPTDSNSSRHADNADNAKTSPDTAWPIFDYGHKENNKVDDSWDAFDDIPTEPKVSKQAEAPNDDWGEWDAFDTKEPKANQAKPSSSIAQDNDAGWAWDAVVEPSEPSLHVNADQAPPINIPPPSILLSIFPQLLGQANESLYKPVSGQAFSIKNRILSDPKTIDFLRGYTALATVAARVIAGRKHRWHRDKFLAQSMSISSAGSKGMKLAGVDKTQATREDREAGDILDLWKEHVGRLRSSVATANQSIKDATKHLKVPDLRENMQAQTAKSVLSAPKACVICGLKRDERLLRVDVDVEDSFGEWWTEHWGHTTCKKFWLKHETALRQR